MPKFESANGLFVTGTDTGVGKTLVAGAIAARLHQSGCRVGVFKPIATGCQSRREGLVSPDAEFLAHCSDSRFSLELINPVRFREPLAPWPASERAQIDIDWEAMQLAYRNITQASDITIVEGIGGLMVPIRRDYMVIDLIKDMQLPVLVVCRSGLGTLNHTLMSIELCRSRQLYVAGVVMNKYQADSRDLSEESNARIITECSQVRVLSVIPYDKESCVEKGVLGKEISAAVRLYRWENFLDDYTPHD